MGLESEAKVETIDLTIEVNASPEHGSFRTQPARTQATHSPMVCLPGSSGRRPKHPFNSVTYTHLWEPQERIVLKMLREHHDNDWDDIVLIFNAIFKNNVPATGLTKYVLKAQFSSITRDSRRCVDTEKLWEMIIGSSESILKSEKETMTLIESTALKIGIQLFKKGILTRPAALDAASGPWTAKRSLDDMTFNESDVASKNTVIDSSRDLASEPPRKRWSGLDPVSSKTPQTSAFGLRTPPSSEQSGRYVGFPRPKTLEIPSRAFEQQPPMSLIPPVMHRLALRSSPTLSSTTTNTETASLYVPSTPSPTELFDEDSLHTTPTLSPECDAETEFFSAHSTASSTEDEDGDEKSVQIHPTLPPVEYTGNTSGNLAKATNEVDLPLLGYRAFSNMSHGYNSNQHFISGLYKDAPSIPPCPAVNDAFYISEAEKHVGKNPSPSPFISVSSTPLRALILAFGFQRRKSSAGAYLATINLKALRGAGVVQKAKDLDLRPAKKYYPANEFLVWGEIKREAIISVIPITNLINSPPRHPYDHDPLAIKEISKHWRARFVWGLIRKVNRENQVFLSCCMGYAVGQFPRILRLPEYCLESAVDGVVGDWGLRCSKHERWQENDIFCEFVQKGYEGFDIGQAQLDTSNVMTISVKQEDINPSLPESPIIILSDDDGDDEVFPDALMQELEKAAGDPDVMSIDDESQARNNKPQTDETFDSLPAYYEAEMEMDLIDQQRAAAAEAQCRLILLPRAYEMELVDM